MSRLEYLVMRFPSGLMGAQALYDLRSFRLRALLLRRGLDIEKEELIAGGWSFEVVNATCGYVSSQAIYTEYS